MAKPKKSKKQITHKRYKVQPQTIGQKDLVDVFNDPKIRKVAITGPAGCGKSLLSCQKLCEDFLAHKFSKLVLLRSLEPVQLEKGVGFLPGSKNEKLETWLAPLLQHIKKFIPNYQEYVRSGQIEYCLLDQIRGRSLDRCGIICTEAQNISAPALKCLLTRVNKNSYLILDGDLEQGDRVNSVQQKIYESLDFALPSFDWVELDNDDIVRDAQDIPIILDVFKKLNI